MWIRGQKGKLSNQLTFLRTTLLNRPHAVFVLSGTPFVGNMQFDMVETIKSLALPSRRAKWTVRIWNEEARAGAGAGAGVGAEPEPVFCYSDKALQKLTEDWEIVDPTAKTQMLVPLLLLRTADTIIYGHPIMPNYMGNLVEASDGEITQAQIAKEMNFRTEMLDAYLWEQSKGPIRYMLARWLSYSSWVLSRQWNNEGRENVAWWNGFSMKEVKEFERGRRLIKMLDEWKREGKRIIIFARAVFHQQYAA